MKKFINGESLYHCFPKISLKMKLTSLFLMVFLFQMNANDVLSQNRKISLNMEQVTIESVLNKIEQNTDYKFLYENNVFDSDRIVSISVKKEKLSSILKTLFKGINVSIIFLEKQIHIKTGNTSNLPKEKKLLEKIKQQQKEISGTITDNEGIPLPGASIIVKGTNDGTISDFDGNFSLTITGETTTLVVSFIGFATQEITIDGQEIINVVLMAETSSLDEVVVVGYGTQSIVKVTNAISSIKSEAIERLPSSSFEESLAGMMAGVQVVQGSGTPGSDSQIIIRGSGTITAGSNPLIVVDGFPLTEGSSLNSINSNDIATIDILKDAASAAIYGSRGSNGVIIITTKKGIIGENKVSVNVYLGFQNVVQSVELMDAYEFSNFVKEGRDNYYTGLNSGVNLPTDSNAIRAQRYPGDKKALIPDYIQPYLNGTQGLTNTNWLEEIFRTAPISSIDLSFSGGTDKTKYFVSGNYFKQGGIVIGSDYERITTRLNLETKISEKVKFGINLTPSLSDQNVVPEGWGDSPITQAINSHPIYSVYNADGSYNLSQQNNEALVYDMAQTENPVAVANSITNNIKRFRIFGSTFLEFEIIKGLNFKTQFGYDFDNGKAKFYRPSYIGAYRDPAPSVARANETTTVRMNWLFENTLNYNKSFGDHNLDVLAGYSFQKENYSYNQIVGSGFANDLITSVSAAGSTSSTVREYEWSLISYIGRVKYDFAGKYLFSAAIRRDGSSRFGSNSKWGVFPSVSAGWRISQEGFFPKNDFAISELKLRASWGQTGNNQIPNYGSVALLGDANTILGGGVVSGLAPSTSPNANLSWETTSTTDIGLEAGFFSNKLSLVADYYIADTEDMLLEVPVPSHSGFTTSLQNIGKIRNKGFEFAVNANNIGFGEFHWSSSINITTNNNEVLKLAPGQTQIISGSNITKVGGSIGAHYGYIITGVYGSQQEIDGSVHLPTAKVGSYIYKDVNGDNSITSNDRTVLGDFNPDYSFGFSNTFEYKNFDLNILLNGVQGVVIHDRLISTLLYNQEGWGNAAKDLYVNHFNVDNNPNGIYAAATPRPTDNNHRQSNLFVDDGSFVRVRNITFGYRLPEHIVEKLSISKLRFYFTSKNPFTWTDSRNFNPELTSSNPLQPGFSNFGNYPAEKTFVLGLNVSF